MNQGKGICQEIVSLWCQFQWVIDVWFLSRECQKNRATVITLCTEETWMRKIWSETLWGWPRRWRDPTLRPGRKNENCDASSNQSAYLHYHIKVTPTLKHFLGVLMPYIVCESFSQAISMKRNAAMRMIIVNFVKMTISNSLETPQTSVSKNFHPKSALQRRRCCWFVNRFFVVVKDRLLAYKYLSFKDRPWLQPLNY